MVMGRVLLEVGFEFEFEFVGTLLMSTLVVGERRG